MMTFTVPQALWRNSLAQTLMHDAAAHFQVCMECCSGTNLSTLRQHMSFWVRACPCVGLASVFDLGLAKNFVCEMY